MKRILVLLVFIVITAQFATAQNTVGLKAGAGLSNIPINNLPEQLKDNNEYRFVYQGGITFTNYFSPKFGLATELMYELKGSTITENGLHATTVENTLNLHYLSLPVLANYELLPCLKIELGPQIGYRLAANFEKTEASSSFDAEDIYDQEWDFGISGGVKYYPTKNLFLNARYTYGLTQVTSLKLTDFNGEPYLDIKQQNRAFQLSLGYEFNLGKR